MSSSVPHQNVKNGIFGSSPTDGGLFEPLGLLIRLRYLNFQIKGKKLMANLKVMISIIEAILPLLY